MAATVKHVEFPELTCFRRIGEITIIDECIGSVKGFQTTVARNSSFLNIESLKTTLEAAKGLSSTAGSKAYHFTSPYHKHVATAMERIDGFAHKQLDNAEEKYPRAFEITVKEVRDVFHERRKSLKELAVKALERDAREVAIKRLDEKAAPIVTYLESTVASRLNVKTGPHAEGVSAYKRAMELSKGVTGSFQAQTSHKLKHVREHNPLADRTLETVESLTAVVSASISPAVERLSSVFKKLSGELIRFKEVSLSLRENLAERAKAAPIPAPARKAYDNLVVLAESRLRPLIEEAREIAATDASRKDKLLRVKVRVTEEAAPLVSQLKAFSVELWSRSKKAAVVLRHGKHV